MIPEYEDFRPKPPKKDLGSWPFWSSPPELALDYIVKILLFLYLIPSLLGLSLTTTGLSINRLYNLQTIQMYYLSLRTN
jgi:hypothetical protein